MVGNRRFTKQAGLSKVFNGHNLGTKKLTEVYSEFYFCDTYWPAFRKIDFLRALRLYDQNQRRFGK